MNTLTSDTLLELRDLSAEIAANEAIWAVILRSAGEHFSVGVDVAVIGGMIGLSPEVFAEKLRELQGCLDAFEAIPKPTIAAIRGYCVGGAVILSLCCDFRIASATAKFSLPEVKRGIAVLMGTGRLTRTIGLARTKELTLLGESIHAEIALSYGLVNRVVDDDHLESEVEAFAAKFRRLPPRTIRIAKHIAEQSQHLSLRENQELEIRLQSELLNSADFQEGVASFFEKRPPHFTGE
jgi:enoyl-CoA hydratase/carnithine racemase